MGMESVYKLSVILNLVDNLSGQMNSVQSSVSGSVDKLNSAFGTMQKAGVAMAGIGGTITGLAMKQSQPPLIHRTHLESFPLWE